MDPRDNDLVLKAQRREAFTKWQASHFAAWVALESANGRGPAELTWPNCARETNVVTTDAEGHRVVKPSLGKLVEPPS